jgi:hypothetical protein
MAAKTQTKASSPKSGRSARPAARQAARPDARPAARPTAHPAAHPREVANLAPEMDDERDPDQPFEEGVRDSLDPDLRHRMVSETAFRLYEERGCADGYELDDWLQAEAEVDHLVLNPKVPRTSRR